MAGSCDTMRGFLCPNATDAFSRINARSPRRVRIACAGRYSFTISICLFDHLAGEAVACHMHLVMLLAFNNGIVVQAGCIWFEGARLSHHVDQHIPIRVWETEEMAWVQLPFEPSQFDCSARSSVEARL